MAKQPLLFIAYMCLTTKPLTLFNDCNTNLQHLAMRTCDGLTNMLSFYINTTSDKSGMYTCTS